MVSNRRLKFLFKALCKRYNIPACRIFFTNLNPKIEANGMLIASIRYPEGSKILIDKNLNNDKLKIQTIYHEFRHYWQLCHYTKIFSIYNKYHNIFRLIQFCPLNILEEDALIFSLTRRRYVPEFLLDLRWILALLECKDQESFEALCHNILSRYPEEVLRIRDNYIPRSKIFFESLSLYTGTYFE